MAHVARMLRALKTVTMSSTARRASGRRRYRGVTSGDVVPHTPVQLEVE